MEVGGGTPAKSDPVQSKTSYRKEIEAPHFQHIRGWGVVVLLLV